jgi:hypothetical protein
MPDNTMTDGVLLREINEAENHLVQHGLDATARDKPHLVDLVLTGLILREIRKLSPNPNGRIRQTATRVGVPVVGGAGIMAVIVEIIRLLAG